MSKQEQLNQEEFSAILKAIIGLTERMTRLEKAVKKSKCCGQCQPNVPFDDEDGQKIW